MQLSPQDAMIYMMIITGAADRKMTDIELDRVKELVARLPVFQGVESARVAKLSDACFAAMAGAEHMEDLLGEIVEAIPERLYDTAYALAVEVAVVDLKLPQEELRWLEMIRDHMEIDRLITAAIESAARARMRLA